MIADTVAAIGRGPQRAAIEVGPRNPPVEDLMMTERFHGTCHVIGKSSASHNLKNLRQRERQTDRRVFS
jgi:hypothetical protein